MRKVYLIADSRVEASKWATSFGLERWEYLKKPGQLHGSKDPVVVTFGSLEKSAEVIRRASTWGGALWIYNPEMDPYRSSNLQTPVLRREVLEWKGTDYNTYTVFLLKCKHKGSRLYSLIVMMALDVERLMAGWRGDLYADPSVAWSEQIEGKEAAERRVLEIRRLNQRQRQDLASSVVRRSEASCQGCP